MVFLLTHNSAIKIFAVVIVRATSIICPGEIGSDKQVKLSL
jgi:hypothetical protein